MRMQAKNILSRIGNIIASTLFLGICFGILFMLYIIFIPWPSIPWVLAFSWIIVPLLAALVVCFIINRNNFHFKGKSVGKNSFERLIYRLLGATIFLLVGLFVGNIHPNTYGQIFVSILCNFSFYAVISIFISAFAVLECLFVGSKTK